LSEAVKKKKTGNRPRSWGEISSKKTKRLFRKRNFRLWLRPPNTTERKDLSMSNRLGNTTLGNTARPKNRPAWLIVVLGGGHRPSSPVGSGLQRQIASGEDVQLHYKLWTSAFCDGGSFLLQAEATRPIRPFLGDGERFPGRFFSSSFSFFSSFLPRRWAQVAGRNPNRSRLAGRFLIYFAARSDDAAGRIAAGAPQPSVLVDGRRPGALEGRFIIRELPPSVVPKPADGRASALGGNSLLWRGGRDLARRGHLSWPGDRSSNARRLCFLPYFCAPSGKWKSGGGGPPIFAGPYLHPTLAPIVRFRADLLRAPHPDLARRHREGV